MELFKESIEIMQKLNEGITNGYSIKSTENEIFKVKPNKNTITIEKNLTKEESEEGISVVVACKNRTEFLAKTFYSWILPEVNEIIIVDWDSDITLKGFILELDKKIFKNKKIIYLRVENQPRWILSKAYNLGIRYASFNKILKIDSDIVLDSDFFKKHQLQEGTFYSGNYKKARNDNERHLSGTSLFYKDDFFQVNGYNENIISYGWDDSDLYNRFIKIGLEQKEIENDSLFHIIHDDNLRIQYQLDVNNINAEIKKNVDKTEFLKEWNMQDKMSEFIVKNNSLIPWMYVARESLGWYGNEIATEKPIVSIITSVFKGDKYIEPFLIDITNQTIFDKCELILINPNSPGEEEKIINKFLKKYDNISYFRLPKDPGLYECWNIAIRLSRGKYITNANIDDRRAKNHIEEHVKILENDLSVDAVSAPLYVTEKINETFEDNTSKISWFLDFPEYFSGKDMFRHDSKEDKVFSQNILHCMPVWRKSLHEKNRFFDEKNYGISADWEFWLRCSKNGSKYRLIKQPLGLYYLDKNSYGRRFKDTEEKEKLIIEMYYNIKKIVDGLISEKNKFIYINNPKAACSSIKFAIGKALGINEELLGKWNKGIKGSGNSLLDYKAINVLDPKYKDYFKFTFVRNPFDRIVSCYEDKLNIKKRNDIHSAKKIINFIGKFDISLKEFIDYLCINNNEFSDPHWNPQYTLVQYSNRIIVDFIGKFENISKDFQTVLNKINLKANLPHLVKTNHEHYSKFYDSFTKEKTAQLYKKDIDLFNYKFENGK